jgi:predicted NAD/FAD-binding protein
VHGGSAQYRDKLIAPFIQNIKISYGIKKVVRQNDKAVIITTEGSVKIYDKVIFACHADQALALLADPTEDEIRLLKNFQYQKNVATLHTDESIMPKTKSTWSAWNYRVEKIKNEITTTTVYDMNILQQVSAIKNYYVSINDPGVINPKKIIREINYEHPVFTPKTAKAQMELHKLNENGLSYFCGSYFRFGFHEDAFTSAIDLCRNILNGDPWTMSPDKIREPALVRK